MKLSVSVPDELWKEVAGEGESPSEVVQRTLREYAARRTSRSRDLRSRDQAARMERIQERLREEAKAAFSAGYDLGLQMAEELPWELVACLATAQAHSRSDIARAAEDNPALVDVLERLRHAVREFHSTALDGASQAFRDLWTSVNRDLPSSPGTSSWGLADVVFSASPVAGRAGEETSRSRDPEQNLEAQQRTRRKARRPTDHEGHPSSGSTI